MSLRSLTRLALAGAALSLAGAGFAASSPATAAGLALCGNPGTAPGPIQHVVIVMLENQSYPAVVTGKAAPYESGTLATSCGVAANMYGATHWSAANYLAVTGGQYPPQSTPGCGTVAACTMDVSSLFGQADAAGLGWRDYVEGGPATPTDCSKAKNLGSSTKIGHQPGLFYGLADCPADVVPVPDLTAASGALWSALQGGSLPAVSWITPNQDDIGEGTNPAQSDTWLQAFLSRVQASTTYQAGRTVVFVTYDEGKGADAVLNEDCTDKAADLAGSQGSCHIPFFVVYPYAGATTDSTFFDHYSVTRTVEDIFGWSHIAHAADAQTASLVGHFGLMGGLVAPPAPRQYVTNPSVERDLTGWSGRYTATSKIQRVAVAGGSQDGGWAVQVSNAAAKAAAAGLSNKKPMWVDGTTTPTIAGTAYTAGAWVRGTAGQQVRLRVAECAPGGVSCGAAHVDSVSLTDGSWTQLAEVVTATSSGGSLWVGVLSPSLAPGASFLADAFSLTSPS